MIAWARMNPAWPAMRTAGISMTPWGEEPPEKEGCLSLIRDIVEGNRSEYDSVVEEEHGTPHAPGKTEGERQ